MLIKDTNILWKRLRGIICVYKPAETSVKHLRSQLINKICSDLNALDTQNYNESLGIPAKFSTEIAVDVKQDLREHPLVYGPKFDELDLSVSWSNFLGWNTSGVLIFGLRSGTQTAKFIRENQSTRAYRIQGVLGQATDTGFKDGKVVEKSTWKYIRQLHMDRMLSSMQAAHQKKMFEMCGVDMQSQLAYELAVQGPIRPANSKIPIIYGLKCIDFQGPNFTLEVQCINEYETYLKNLIHEIGMKLHSTAHCISVKCIRHSCFTLDHALLPKHWNIHNIIENIETCNELLKVNEDIVKQTNIALR